MLFVHNQNTKISLPNRVPFLKEFGSLPSEVGDEKWLFVDGDGFKQGSITPCRLM